MQFLRFMAGLFLALCLVSPVYASPSPFSGKTVTRVDIKDEEGNPWPRPEQVLPLITVPPGAAFSGAAVRESISLLYLKGMFKDVRVDAFPDEGGVRLEYTLFPTTVVEKVAIHGNDALSTSMISEAIPPVEGRELQKLSAIRADILALYQAQGLYETTVSF